MNPNTIFGKYLIKLVEKTILDFRATGRTMDLLNSLSGGELVVMATSKDRQWMHEQIRHRGIKAFVVYAVPEEGLLRAAQMARGQRFTRVVFDHTFYEQFYKQSLEQAARQLNLFADDFTQKGPTQVWVDEARDM